ncbi:UNVERIFIED_CONTAM: Vacuolar protein sorting-associated protein 37B [Trichonephila clavipes]
MLSKSLLPHDIAELHERMTCAVDTVDVTIKMNSTLFTPDYSHLTGLLKHLNDDELKELLNNEEKMKELVSDLKQVHDIEAEREMLFASNKSISEYNLSQQPILEEYRRQLKETQKIALELKNSLLEKKRKIESCQQNTSKETILALLQAATSEKEEEAEAAVNAFLENEISVDEFLLKYLEIRKMAHLRRTKAEKMANLLLENGSNIPTPPVRSQKLRKPPPPPSTAAPYPPPFPNSVAQSNVTVPIRPAPQFPPMHNNTPQYPYPGRVPFNPYQTRPPVAPYPSYGYGPYPNSQYPQPTQYGHYK